MSRLKPSSVLGALFLAVLLSAQFGCVEARWDLLFRHTRSKDTPNDFFFGDRNDLLAYGTSEADPNFSILDQLESKRQGDGKFEFKYTDGIQTQTWKQSYNPLASNSSSSDVQQGQRAPGYEDVSIASSGCYWAGLVLSAKALTWLDGSGGDSLWFAVGMRKEWDDGKIPGICGNRVTSVELYAFVFDGPCGPGEFVGEFECTPCPQDTYSENAVVTANQCTQCADGTKSFPGSSSCWSVQPGWNTLFRQTYDNDQHSDLPFTDYDKVRSFGEEEDPNYSRLGFLDMLKSQDGKFTLRFFDGVNNQIWRQSSNFVLGETAAGYEPVFIPSVGCHWTGLVPGPCTWNEEEPSPCGTAPWFDGSAGDSYWWSIGLTSKWGEGFIPGVCGHRANVVELSVHFFPGYCEAGEYLAASGTWCFPCPVNTYTNETQVTASNCAACPDLTYAWPGSAECVPVEPTGEWITIFKQSSGGSSDAFSFEANALSFGDSEEDPNFSRLQDLETFRDSRDGKFTLKYSDGTNTQIWRQSLNFVTDGAHDPSVEAAGYEPVAISSDACNWGGLQRAGRTTSAWFDGSTGSSNWWSIGDKDGSSIAGSCQHTTTDVKLEVYVFSGFCGVGERVDPTGPNCLPCAVNTYSNNPKFPGIDCPDCPLGTYAVEGQTECVAIDISSGWNLAFRQSFDTTDDQSDNDENVFIPYENVLFYGEDTKDPNYSRLAHLDDFRDTDGKFHFKYTDGQSQQLWKQTSNFVTTDVLTTSVQGLENLEEVASACTDKDWGGLQQTTGHDNAWFDGSTGSRWWWAVGTKVEYRNGGIPGVCARAASQVELWAYKFPGFCSPGEFVVSAERRCAKCPQGTYTDDTQVTTEVCKQCPSGTFAVPGSSECKHYGVKAGWTTIFRHTRSTGDDDFLFSSLEQALWLNADAPESPNFSILQLVSSAFFQEGRYRFRYLSDGGRERIWRQTSNPTTTVDAVTGYRAETHPAAPGDDDACNWHGLALSSGDQTYLDGSFGSRWWFAVGQRIQPGSASFSEGQIPGDCNYRATSVEVQAYLFDGTCGAGEYLDAGLFCSACPANTITTETSHTLTECTPCPYGHVAVPGSSVCLDLIIDNGWTLLFRQTHPFKFDNYHEALWLNPNKTASDNYSILTALELLRERGRFKFKYVNVYPGEEAKNRETIWTQTSNFVDALAGETPTGVAMQTTAPNVGSDWQGLAHSESEKTWWDGSAGARWWWALGTKGSGSDHAPNGIPGVWQSSTPRTELWAFRAYDPIKCEPGEIIDEQGNCVPCSQNTVSDGDLQFECTDCPEGEFAPPGQSTCAPCPAGHKWDVVNAQCAYCPMNTFALGNTTTCEACPAGEYSATAATECLTPIPCNESFGRVCHHMAQCDDATCICPVGFIGDGEGAAGCSSTGYTVRFSMKYLSDPGLRLPDGTLAFWDSHLRDQFAALLGLASGGPANFKTSMHHEVAMVEVDPTMDPVGLITINALFALETDAETAAAALRANLNLASGRRSNPVSFSGIPLTDSNVIGPDVYTWVSPTTSAPLQIEATGMDVTAVSFSPACEQTGCWVIDVTFTLGRDAYNVLYMPHAVGDDTAATDFNYGDVSQQDWSAPRYNYAKSASSTFVASNFPCGSANYVPDAAAYPPLKVTACCLPEFIDMYRPLKAFYDDVRTTWGIDQSDCELSTTEIPIFDRPDWAADDNHPRRIAERPTSYVHGSFKGMSYCSVELTEVVDPYIRQYKATIKCDEQELRTKAGMLRGTVGVEHTVDTFVGIANFKPSGITFLDSAAMQVAIHLEKTNFFTVSSHGVNDYTFLQYVNLRLVAVYNEDTDLSEAVSTDDSPRTVRTNATGAAHYLQVTFTMGSQYIPNENSGLIPLDSVRVGKGTFASSTDMTFHSCASYAALAGYSAFPSKTVFDGRFPDPANPSSQRCAPNAAMCVSPTSVPDHFVSFNVPLGIDWLPATATGAAGDLETLSNNVFVHMVVSAKDKDQIGVSTPNDGEDPHQMKTTLSASIPVVQGGVNIFCDGITAKTDLQDVVNVDLIFGTAANATELSRLRIFEDIADSVLDRTAARVFETASIEAGFMTLVVKGNESYFGLGGTQGYGVQLEDVITIHIMEPGDVKYNFVKAKIEEAGEDNYADATTLNVGGYKLNGAFRFEIDRSANRAHLHPTPELLAECAFNPPRPSANVAFPATCVVRRDVQEQGYPVRNGADAATAQEVLADGVADRTTNGEFVQTVLGANEYAMDLGKRFSQTIAKKYALNDRYLRAWFINPGYEWTPTQTGGASIFTVSQRIFLFALINLDENLVRRRTLSSSRMLLQSVSGSGAGMAATELSFAISPTTLMSQAFGVPDANVAIFDVEVQLTEEEACMDMAALQGRLTATFDDYLTGATSKLETVQVLSLNVRNKPSACDRRRAMSRKLLAPFSDAVAATEMMLVFATGSSLEFNMARFEQMAGVVSVAPQSISGTVALVEDPDAPSPQASSSESSESAGASNTAIIAGACGGAGAGALLLAGGVYAVMARRKTQEEVVAPAVQSIDVNELKAQLHNDV